MTVKELLTNIKNKEFDVKKSLEVKEYVPVMEKKRFVTGVIAACTDDMDGYITVDRFKMDIYFHMYLLTLYTNLEISTDFDEVVEQYDMLCAQGTLDTILDIIASDYDALANILEYELESLLNENSLECQVVQLVGKVKNIIDVVGDKIHDVDFNNILSEKLDLTQLPNVVDILKSLFRG